MIRPPTGDGFQDYSGVAQSPLADKQQSANVRYSRGDWLQRVDERRAQPDPLELGTRSPRPPFRSRRTNFFVRLPSLNNLFASDRNSAAR